MRGKRAKELRRAARAVLGPDAPAADYEFRPQRATTGGNVARTAYTGADGKPIMARVRAEYWDTAKWCWQRLRVPTGIPVFKTMGIEPRLTLSCIKGLVARFKAKYRRKLK